MSIKTRWIGEADKAFERVSKAFQNAGFTPPMPDTSGGTGAYGLNIINQYQADLDEQEATAIIERGLSLEDAP